MWDFFGDIWDFYSDVVATCRVPYDLRDTTPKTPYKPSYKTVIFDRRLKFPKCGSNC